jgi:hypothetical protein
LVRILSDQLVPDVPVCFSNHIGEEDALDLIHEEYLSDSLEHFIDGVAEGDIAAARHGAQDRNDRFDLISGVVVERLAVLGRNIAILLVFFAHL